MANGLCIDMWRRREVEQAWLEALAARPASTRRRRVITGLTSCGVLGLLGLAGWRHPSLRRELLAWTADYRAATG